MTSVCFRDDFILHEINFLQFYLILRKLLSLQKRFIYQK